MTLQKFISETQLSNFEAIKAQICKDFEMAGIAFSCDAKDIYALINTLHQCINNLHQSTVNELKNLLYRIDVSETYIQKFANDKTLSLEEAITFAIIKRTAEKIAFREKFKN